MNNPPSVDADDPRWLLSAMADGEADAAAFSSGCAAWGGGEVHTQHSWHVYHLIGDVLRSDDLASPPARDRAFLQRLSARLDSEPAVPVPELLPAAPTRRPGWAVPVALAASVMALAAGLVSLGPSAGGTAAPTLAAAPAAAVDVPVTPPAPPQVAEMVPAGGRIVRDAQLDSYLRAHRDYATALPGSLPGGSGRSIATVSFER